MQAGDKSKISEGTKGHGEIRGLDRKQGENLRKKGGDEKGRARRGPARFYNIC